MANKEVLEGIAALQSNFQLFKSEIVEVIDKRLDQFSTSIKAELTALKKETDVTISAMKSMMDDQAKTMANLESNATFTSDTVSQLLKKCWIANKQCLTAHWEMYETGKSQ